ncbi:hypothetical protein L6452_14619 [Arctium lappa]|uniref:Uncharacterized protein n=1 Tax=Arctium lappa TaxID=4217 RepID=A0ACB9CLL5_ARCLA|nr:hypothetical protein L6452_14619 [Arctium lappa]
MMVDQQPQIPAKPIEKRRGLLTVGFCSSRFASRNLPIIQPQIGRLWISNKVGLSSSTSIVSCKVGQGILHKPFLAFCKKAVCIAQTQLHAFSRFTSVAREGQWFLLIFRDKAERSWSVCRNICG